jgi:phosphatidylglycerol lysyltransferase
MPAKVKRIFKKILSWSGIFFFALAAGMLYWQLRNYSLVEIARTLWNIPLGNLVLALLSAFLGYVSLSIYDYLALRYVGKMVTWWKWMLAGMLGFAISNNAGHAVVSGSAIRYRLYTRWRIRGGEIVKIMTFSGFTYFMGSVATMVIGYFLAPRELFTQTTLGSIGIYGLFLFSSASLGAYFAMTVLFRDKKIKIGSLDFKIPSTTAAMQQTLLGAIDSVFNGLVLYFVMIPFVDVPFGTFIGIFVIAQVAGVFSQVPGGIGVFETIFMMALPGDFNKAALFASLLAYRIIYFVLPLAGAGGLFFLYENGLRAKMKKWAAEAKALAAKFPRPHLPVKK